MHYPGTLNATPDTLLILIVVILKYFEAGLRCCGHKQFGIVSNCKVKTLLKQGVAFEVNPSGVCYSYVTNSCRDLVGSCAQAELPFPLVKALLMIFRASHVFKTALMFALDICSSTKTTCKKSMPVIQLTIGPLPCHESIS